jgi:hypothetical protein
LGLLVRRPNIGGAENAACFSYSLPIPPAPTPFGPRSPWVRQLGGTCEPTVRFFDLPTTPRGGTGLFSTEMGITCRFLAPFCQ